MIAMMCTVVATVLMGVAGADPAGDFTACMRAHGQSDFPAATVTPDGRILLDPGAGAVDPFDAGYRAALAACTAELPAGIDPPVPPQPPAPPRLPDVPAPAEPHPPAPPRS